MKLTAKECALAALMAALLCVLSPISIPVGTIPLTLQTFAVALCGAMLGPGLGALSVVVYLLIGAVGVPVFNGFTAGFGRFVGPTGGYLFAFPAVATLSGLFRSRSVYAQLSSAVASLLILYLAGTAQLAFVLAIPFRDAAIVGILPFIAKDAISVVLAVLASRGITRIMKRSAN